MRKMLGIYSNAITSPLYRDGLSDPFYQRLKESVAKGCRVVCGRPAAFSSYDQKAADPRQDQAWEAVKKSDVEKTPATGQKILAIRRPQSNPRGWGIHFWSPGKCAP